MTWSLAFGRPANCKPNFVWSLHDVFKPAPKCASPLHLLHPLQCLPKRRSCEQELKIRIKSTSKRQRTCRNSKQNKRTTHLTADSPNRTAALLLLKARDGH